MSLHLLVVSLVLNESPVLTNHDKGVVMRDLRDKNMEIGRDGGGLLV